MQKRFLCRILIFTVTIALLLAGCSKVQTGNNPGTDPGMGEGGMVSLPMQLALGTLSLEGTENEVTSEQAAELLPLWKAVKSLSSSGNVTTEEMDGLYKQIQKAMTPEQMQAIQAMDLSGENMGEVMKKLGIEPLKNPMGELSPEIQATMEARRSSGERPEGFVPGSGQGGGMGPEFGGGPPPGFSGSGQSDQEEQSQPDRRPAGFNFVFSDAVIQLLEKKTH